MNMLFTIGLPLRVDEMIFNVAVTILRGKILGVVAKSRLPNEREFYEGRHFLPASSIRPTRKTVSLCGMEVPFGDDIIFLCLRQITISGCTRRCARLAGRLFPQAFTRLRLWSAKSPSAHEKRRNPTRRRRRKLLPPSRRPERVRG